MRPGKYKRGGTNLSASLRRLASVRRPDMEIGCVTGSSFAEPVCCEPLVKGVGKVLSILGGPNSSPSASAGRQKAGTKKLIASAIAACLLAFENNLMASDSIYMLDLVDYIALPIVPAGGSLGNIDMLDGYGRGIRQNLARLTASGPPQTLATTVKEWLLDQVPLMEAFLVAVSIHVALFPIMWFIGFALPWPKSPVITTIIEYDLGNWPEMPKPKKIFEFRDPKLNQ